MKALSIGIDEVGRGCIAGPVVVGACRITDFSALETVLRAVNFWPLRDSKRLSRLQRQKVLACVSQVASLGIGVGSVAYINESGLASALRAAASDALTAIFVEGHEHIAADYGLGHNLTNPTEWFVRGDERVPAIGLASIAAKEYRDELMRRLSEQYPQYGWESNVGYPTASHRNALERYGACSEHRRFGSLKLP